MDELLSLMEEGLEEDMGGSGSGSGSGSSSGYTASGSTTKTSQEEEPGVPSTSQSKKKKDLTFNDVFGSPDKRDVKELGLSPPTTSLSSSSTKYRKSLGSLPLSSKDAFSTGGSSQGHGSSNQLELSRAIRLDKNVPYKPEVGSVVIDPYSRVRVVKNSITIYFDETMTPEAALKDRNIGLEFVNLQSFTVWYRGKGKDVKNFWISGVLIKKTAGVRKSAKGNDYGIWELCDLRDLDKKVTVFLFGSASSSSALSSTPAGSLIDITSPSVMHDSSNGGASKFSISNASQVRLIATSKDFGYCQATKKDGNKCTAIVNTWECSFCIHHAAGELKKLNIGSKKGKSSKGKAFGGGLFPNRSFSGGETGESLKEQGVTIANFGAGPRNSLFSESKSAVRNPNPVSSPAASKLALLPNSRMELQGVKNEMKTNHIKFGNHESIKFVRNSDHRLFKDDPKLVAPRKSLDLNPMKTRHLSDKDRDLLKMLDNQAASSSGTSEQASSSGKIQQENKSSNAGNSTGGGGAVSELITSAIVTNPNAASRNFLQFLQLQHAPKDQVDLKSTNKSTAIQPVVMSREKVKSMQKALAFVKKNGPIPKANPNAVTGQKRKFQQLSQNETSGSQGPSLKKQRSSGSKIDVEFDFESEDFKKILNAKSAHDDELDAIQHEEYFGKLEKKEALENKLLSTYSIETNAVMCRQCKYVALSQSEFCKELMHEIKVVKAKKRFFKCKDCGNRTMSLDRLPKRPCSNCNNSSWLVAPVGKERKGPTLPSEMLAVRGHEEKFIGSAASKMFLNLEV